MVWPLANTRGQLTRPHPDWDWPSSDSLLSSSKKTCSAFEASSSSVNGADLNSSERRKISVATLCFSTSGKRSNDFRNSSTVVLIPVVFIPASIISHSTPHALGLSKRWSAGYLQDVCKICG